MIHIPAYMYVGSGEAQVRGSSRRLKHAVQLRASTLSISTLLSQPVDRMKALTLSLLSLSSLSALYITPGLCDHLLLQYLTD